MRFLTHRSISLFMLGAVLVLLAMPIASFDTLGQESNSPGPTIAADPAAAVPTETPAPAVIPSEPPPVEAQPTEPPPVDQLAPTEIVIEPATEVATLAVVENSPSPTNAAPPPETAASAPASATATDFPVQAAAIPIVADLTPAVCGDSWQFAISGLTTATAPPQIGATFQNAGTVQIPLLVVTLSGTAIYQRSSGLDDTALSAAAIVPDNFSGTFVLLTKGCAIATATQTPVPQVISADLSPAACGNSWRFSITGLTASTAPPTIAVIYANAGPVQIPLFFNTTSGVAFYPRSSGLDDTVLSATATVPVDFSGTFVLDTKGCAISTATPTQTPVPQVISADLSPAACGNSWRFSITGLTATTAPPTIAVIFANAGPLQIPLFFNETSGVAFYNRSSGLDDTVISASATVPGNFAGVFQLDTKGCLGATATSTATPSSQNINADMTTGSCGVAWSFQITGIDPPVSAPANITVFEGGADFSMDLQQPQTGSIAIYSRADLNALELDSARARISSAWNGAFTLLTFPCDDFTPSPTATGTPASQSINADPDGAVCGAGWRFEITGIEPPIVAPNPIALLTSSGDFSVSQSSIVGTSAFYERSDLPPNFTFVSATARISSSWTGEFNLLTFPCVDTPTPTSTSISPPATATDTATNTPITPSTTPTDTPTNTAVPPSSTPTATPTNPAEVEISADLDDCEESTTAWLFRLSNTVDGGQNPLSITATFDTGSVSVPRFASLIEGSTFVGLYIWDQNLSDTLLSATAMVPGNVTFVFRLAQGPGCDPAPSATATASVTASSTATATKTTTSSATATRTTTPTSTATVTRTTTPTWTATASATHRPHLWPSHTPPASHTPVPPIGGLPVTGAGASGSSNGLWILMAGIGALAVLGLGLRRRRMT